MNLIKMKQLDSGDVGAFVTNLIVANTGNIFTNNVPMTSGLQFESLSFGRTYTINPKVTFSINKVSGNPNITPNILSKTTSSALFDYGTGIPSGGYTMDIITSL